MAAGAALAIVACAGPNVATTESDDDGASAARSEAHEIVLHVGTDESIRGVHQGSPDLLCQFRERQGREQLREWAATVVQGLPTRALSTGLGAAAGLEIRDGRAVIVTERETPFRTVQHLMEAMASPNVQLPDIVLRVDGREHPIPLPTVEFDAEPRDTVDVLVQKSKDGTTTFEMRTAKTVLLGPPRPETNAETPEEEAVAEVEPPRTDMRTDLSAWAATVDSFDATVDARRGTTVGDAIDAMDALRDAGVDRIVWIGSYER